MGEDIKVVQKLKIVLTKIRLPIYYLKLGLGKDKSQLIQNKSLGLYNICVCIIIFHIKKITHLRVYI